MKNNISKYLFILFIIILIIVSVNILLFYFKPSGPKTSSKTTSKPSQIKTVLPSPIEKNISPTVSPPAEGQIGTVVDVSIKPDGKVAVTVDKKTYLFQASQKVSLYTSKTASDSVSINQLKKGTMINVIKFTKPERYEVVGVTDKGLVDKLL